MALVERSPGTRGFRIQPFDYQWSGLGGGEQVVRTSS